MGHNKEELSQLVKEHGPWFHNIEFPHGILTNPAHPNNPSSIWKSVSKLLPSTPGATVLDIGCNGGFMEIELERLGYQVDAIDINPLYVRQTTLVKDVFDLHCNVSQADISKTSIGQYDIILLLGVIYHVDDMIGVLRNALASTKSAMIIETAINGETQSVIDFMNYEIPYSYRFLPSLSAVSKMVEYCGGKVTTTDIWCPGVDGQRQGRRASLLVSKKE